MAKELEKQVDRLYGVGSVGLQKGENYAMLKMEEGPSDNEPKSQELRKGLHSQKYGFSGSESQASKKEAARLTTTIHDLCGQADWAQNRANLYWKQAKEYEVQGRMDMALIKK